MKKVLLILGVSILISSLSFYGCKEEKDDDLMEGKWVSVDAFSDCEKASYLEFSKYSSNVKERTIMSFNSCNEPPTNDVFGYYTIKGDSLLIRTTYYEDKVYKIDYITSEAMQYHDPLNTFKFKRMQ